MFRNSLVSIMRFVVSLITNSSTFHYNFLVTTPLDSIFIVLPLYSCGSTVFFRIIVTCHLFFDWY